MSNSTIERTPGFIIMGIVYSRKRETALRSKTDRTPLDVEITDMKREEIVVKQIKLTFPNGTVVRADLLEQEEPELCESLWEFAKEEQPLICHNTLSTGYSFPAFRRPSRSPNTESHLANPIGRHKIGYTSLVKGNLLWSGTKLYVVYGFCTEPSIAGAVTAQVVDEDMDAFVKAGEDVWYHTYFYHKLAVLKVEREGN